MKQILDDIDHQAVKNYLERKVLTIMSNDKELPNIGEIKILVCMGTPDQVEPMILSKLHDNDDCHICDTDNGDNPFIYRAHKTSHDIRMVQVPYTIYLDKSGKYINFLDEDPKRSNDYTLWVYYVAYDLFPYTHMIVRDIRDLIS